VDIKELNKLFQEAESDHRRLFAEMRSNLQLVAGNHYSRSKNSRFLRNVRASTNLTKNQKLRLTKNHIQKITKTYVNNILHYAPGVRIGPKNKNEAGDRKSADLNNSVWQDIKERHKMKKIVYRLVNDYIKLGEAWIKIFWDDNLGQHLGYEPMMDEETGEMLVDEMGEPIAVPFMSGDLVYETPLGFNVLSDPGARSEEESRWNCIKKMEKVDKLKKIYADREDILEMITESGKATWKLFDGATGDYTDNKGLVLMKEWYFKPDSDNPEGRYYFALENGILHEGDLPLGIYPLSYAGFDELETSARSQSIIKQLRPYQAEVNRAASKIAEHQITLGDDKIITQKGTSITTGGQFHGVRHLQTTGGPPTILQGRSGEQYLGYMQSQIAEMYQISNVMEDSTEEAKQLDPYSMLFRSLKEKKKFTLYSDKIEDLLKDVTFKSLKLKKAFARDEEIIPVVGRNEIVNIAEWRSTDDLSYQIELEAQSEDIETKLGRQLAFNHILQYAGTSLPPKELGKIIKAMPYANEEEAFGDFTIDYENAQNDILQLEKGQMPKINRYEEHTYTLSRLVHRMKQPDFEYLDPQVQQLMEQYKNQLNQIVAQKSQEEAMKNAGFIPSGGALIAADMYVPKPGSPDKSQRARIPQEALNWLIKRLEQQGSTQQALQDQNPQVQSEIVQLMQARGGQGQGRPQLVDPGQASPI
jgi:hypothetical protein